MPKTAWPESRLVPNMADSGYLVTSSFNITFLWHAGLCHKRPFISLATRGMNMGKAWKIRKRKFQKLLKKGVDREIAKKIVKKTRKCRYALIKEDDGTVKAKILHAPGPRHKTKTPPQERIEIPKLRNWGVIINIMHSIYPDVHLIKSELENIEELILEEIIEHTGAGIIPKFLDISFCNGYLRVTCVDRPTAEWLKGIERTLQSVNTAIKVKEDTVSSPRETLVGYFPDSQTYPEEKVLGLIDIQNEEIYSSSWVVVSKKPLENGTMSYAFSIDHESLKLLKKSNCRVNFKLGKVQLKMMGASDDRVLGGNIHPNSNTRISIPSDLGSASRMDTEESMNFSETCSTDPYSDSESDYEESNFGDNSLLQVPGVQLQLPNRLGTTELCSASTSTNYGGNIQGKPHEISLNQVPELPRWTQASGHTSDPGRDSVDHIPESMYYDISRQRFENRYDGSSSYNEQQYLSCESSYMHHESRSPISRPITLQPTITNNKDTITEYGICKRSSRDRTSRYSIERDSYRRNEVTSYEGKIQESSYEMPSNLVDEIPKQIQMSGHSLGCVTDRAKYISESVYYVPRDKIEKSYEESSYNNQKNVSSGDSTDMEQGSRYRPNEVGFPIPDSRFYKSSPEDITVWHSCERNSQIPKDPMSSYNNAQTLLYGQSSHVYRRSRSPIPQYNVRQSPVHDSSSRRSRETSSPRRNRLHQNKKDRSSTATHPVSRCNIRHGTVKDGASKHLSNRGRSPTNFDIPLVHYADRSPKRTTGGYSQPGGISSYDTFDIPLRQSTAWTSPERSTERHSPPGSISRYNSRKGSSYNRPSRRTPERYRGSQRSTRSPELSVRSRRYR